MENLPKRKKVLIISWLASVIGLYFLFGRKIHFESMATYIIGAVSIAIIVLITIFIKDRSIRKMHVLLLVAILVPILGFLIALVFVKFSPEVAVVLVLLGIVAGDIITTRIVWNSIRNLRDFFKKK